MTNMLKVFGLFSLLFSFNSSLSAQGWSTRRLADMPIPISNNAVSEGYLSNGDTCVYSFGGIDSTLIWSGITRNSFRYNLRTNSWDTLADLPDTLGKIASFATRIKDTIYIIGGYHVLQNTNEISSNRVHRYVTTTNSYLSDGANIPFPVDDQVQCSWHDSLIFVITGWSNNGNIPNVQIYNPYFNTWTQGTAVPNTNQYKAFGGSGIINYDTIYYYGGANTSSNFPATNYIRKGIINPLNPTTITWSLIPNPTLINAYRSACVIDNGNWVEWIGGSETSYNYDGIAYNGSGAVPISPDVRILIPYLNQVGACGLFDSLPNDLRGIAKIKNWQQSQSSNYIIAGGMWSNQKVSNQTLLLDWEWKGAVQENFMNNAVRIFPVPASDNININFEKYPNSKTTIKLIDSIGRIILSESSIVQYNSFDTNLFPAGLYCLLIETQNEMVCKPILIQH